MFKKLAIVLAITIGSVSIAYADGYHRRHHHHHYHHRNNGGGWAGPMIGGFAAGAIIGNLTAPRYYAPPPVYYTPSAPVYVQPSSCWDEFVYYDQWNRPIIKRVCR